MGSSLMKVLPNIDISELSSVLAKLTKYGAMGRAVYNNRTAVKVVTPHGAKLMSVIEVPHNMTKAQRNDIIEDLLNLGLTQELTGAATGTSQSTVSRVHRMVK